MKMLNTFGRTTFRPILRCQSHRAFSLEGEQSSPTMEEVKSFIYKPKLEETKKLFETVRIS